MAETLKHYILDEHHHPVEEPSFLRWAEWFETRNRIVDRTDINPKTYVSTVFLGMDHRYYGHGPPILFETMIFGGPLDGQTWRYSSWDDAQTGHYAACRKAREAHSHHEKK
jgi:hypothetical protein